MKIFVRCGLSVALAAALACSSREAPARPALRDVPLPDVSQMNEAVRQQVRERHDVLSATVAAASTPDSERAAAYGDVGQILLAARYLDSAEPALLNARTLAPQDATWPYYLAQLYRSRGALDQSAQFFREVLAKRPDDLAALTWLAAVEIDRGRHAEAKPLVDRALQLGATSEAVQYQAGRLALATRDFAAAAHHLETVLQRNDRAAAAHYPLAVAYRALGREKDAETHLRLRDERNSEIAPPDPLMERLDALLQGPQMFLVRGTEALSRGQWPKAADEFRRGLDASPRDPSLRHRLATAMYMMGRADEAQRGFEEVIRVSPAYAPAHYSLGLILEGRGQEADALARYTAAVNAQPDYLPARLKRASALRRSGRAEEALADYEDVLRRDPRSENAALESAITLVRLGRYADARSRLVTGMETFPDHPGFALALARLLAAAPDDRVRDGRRALALAETLVKTNQSLEVGETMAMALAEVGQYGEATRVQRELIAAAREAGRSDLVAPLEENLRRYLGKQASRTPWRDQDVGDAPSVAQDLRDAF
jgi:tetratricopeptide (TPR) repeat protein